MPGTLFHESRWDGLALWAVWPRQQCVRDYVATLHPFTLVGGVLGGLSTRIFDAGGGSELG